MIVHRERDLASKKEVVAALNRGDMFCRPEDRTEHMCVVYRLENMKAPQEIVVGNVKSRRAWRVIIAKDRNGRTVAR